MAGREQDWREVHVRGKGIKGGRERVWDSRRRERVEKEMRQYREGIGEEGEIYGCGW